MAAKDLRGQIEREHAALADQDAVVERDMAAIREQFEGNKAAVIAMLLAQVNTISLEVPKVVLQKFDEIQ